MKQLLNWRIIVIGLIIAGFAMALWILPVNDYLREMIGWIEGLGFWGPILLAIIYIPACLLFVPGSIITLGAGYAFGVLVGTIAVSIGSTLGAAAAFLAGRTVARSWVEKQLARSQRFQALDQAVARDGFKIVLLTRLSPILPFNLLNYAYGLTSVRFWDYFLASWIGMLPGTIMYVYLGHAARQVTERFTGELPPSEADLWQQILFYVGLAATIAVTIFIARLARTALRTTAPEVTKQP